MAVMTTLGLSELIRDLNVSADDIRDCAEEICTKGAEIIKKEQVATGRAMGVYRTGTTLGSLTVDTFRRTSYGGYREIDFAGKNKNGDPNAMVAFINEYGKTNQPARPFIATANAMAEPKVLRMAIDILDRHLKKHNL